MKHLEYADEVDLLDGLIEFHPEWLNGLPDEAVAVLDAYYGIQSHPADLRVWRDRHVDDDPSLPDKARGILANFPGLS